MELLHFTKRQERVFSISADMPWHRMASRMFEVFILFDPSALKRRAIAHQQHMVSFRISSGILRHDILPHSRRRLRRSTRRSRLCALASTPTRPAARQDEFLGAVIHKPALTDMLRRLASAPHLVAKLAPLLPLGMLVDALRVEARVELADNLAVAERAAGDAAVGAVAARRRRGVPEGADWVCAVWVEAALLRGVVGALLRRRRVLADALFVAARRAKGALDVHVDGGAWRHGGGLVHEDAVWAGAGQVEAADCGGWVGGFDVHGGGGVVCHFAVGIEGWGSVCWWSVVLLASVEGAVLAVRSAVDALEHGLVGLGVEAAHSWVHAGLAWLQYLCHYSCLLFVHRE